MEGYAYPYPPGYPAMRPPESQYLDHGDGYVDYYGMGPLTEDLGRRPSRSKHRLRKIRSRSRSRSVSHSKSRSRSRSKSHSKFRSRTRSRSISRSESRHREINFRDPGFLDAFRVLYLAPSQHKNATKFLATKKRQDRIQEYLKSDGLGSKRWLFYPRSDPGLDAGRSESRDSCDQRIKIDGEFLRKYKKNKMVDSDAPIRKLKRWELIFYKKLGFVHAV